MKDKNQQKATNDIVQLDLMLKDILSDNRTKQKTKRAKIARIILKVGYGLAEQVINSDKAYSTKNSLGRHTNAVNNLYGPPPKVKAGSVTDNENK